MNDKTQPLVTVYMPTYNRVDLLRRAVNSVLNQDYRNIELIVVDDNSTDATHNYLVKIAKEDSRFKYFINEKNSGACISRNKAIYAANGEFITGLDDDDYFLSNHISGFIDNCYLIKGDCIALYCNTYLKEKNIKSLVPVKKPERCTYQHLLTGNWIGNQVFTRTEYLKSIGGFDQSLPAWQDLECWYRLLKTYDKKAILVPQYSYVVDISHPHERITSKKLTSILEAYNIFIKTHKLSHRERTILKLHLNSYTTEPIDFLPIIYGLIHQHDLKNAKRSLALLKNKLKRTIDNFTI